MFGHIRRKVFEVFDKLIILRVLQLAQAEGLIVAKPLARWCFQTSRKLFKLRSDRWRNARDSTKNTPTAVEQWQRLTEKPFPDSKVGQETERRGKEGLFFAWHCSLVALFHPKESVVFLLRAPKKYSSLYGWQGEKDNEGTNGGSVKKVPLCLRLSAALFIYVSKGQMEGVCNAVHHINSFEEASSGWALEDGSSGYSGRSQQEVWYISLWTTVGIWRTVFKGELLQDASSHINLRFDSRFTWHFGICTKCFPLPRLPK